MNVEILSELDYLENQYEIPKINENPMIKTPFI